MTETHESRARARIAAMSAAQTGEPQACAFCGREYIKADDEPCRPRGVCLKCWPEVSRIERDHAVMSKAIDRRAANSDVSALFVAEQDEHQDEKHEEGTTC